MINHRAIVQAMVTDSYLTLFELSQQAVVSFLDLARSAIMRLTVKQPELSMGEEF
jgi:hypothetical protein